MAYFLDSRDTFFLGEKCPIRAPGPDLLPDSQGGLGGIETEVPKSATI